MIGSTVDHFGALYESPVTLVEFEELAALFTSTNINLAVHAALEDSAEVTERVLHMLQINCLAREIFEVVHDDLLSVRHEDGDSVVFGILLEAALCLQDLRLDLLKAAEVYFVEDLFLDFFEVLLLELYLFADLVHLLLKVVHFLFVNGHRLQLA